MAKLIDILAIEQDRKDPEKWAVIHLFKSGGFYSAYEWSAWLTAVVSYNGETRMQSKDRQPLAVIRNTIATLEGQTFCKVGFPLKSVEKFIPARTTFHPVDDNYITITIPLPQPTDGSEITFERLEKAFTEWKESQPIKSSKEAVSSKKNSSSGTSAHVGIIAQIMTYPLNDRTASENIQFISSLQHQIAAIL